VVDVAADRTRLGRHAHAGQAAARDDVRVRGRHVFVGFLQRLGRGVEAVRILHGEFARAHHAEARPELVAELGLDLVDVLRQLLVALEPVARDVRHHFFVRRAERKEAVAAVVQFEQELAEILEPSRLFVQLTRVQHRHLHFLRTGLVHLVAHDRRHLLQHAQSGGQERIHARGETLDEPCPQHELMARNLRVARGFLVRRQIVLRPAHESLRVGEN
jgi:hypothetical protein